MSFTSGVFTLVAGNPVVTGTTISSTWANNTLTDIATGLSTCVLKDGTQTTTASVPFALGVKADTITEFTSGAGITFSKQVNTSQGGDIASASTINLTTATGNIVDVTGTTPITAVTLVQGATRWVRFTGALTLTNGASLVLPGGANITTAAGDYALFVGYASSVVRVAAYVPKTGANVITAPFVDTTAIVKGSADSTKLVRIEADGLTTATTRVWTAADLDIALGKQPTRTVFTSGSGTYTTPAGATRIYIRLVGGGGGGGGNAVAGSSAGGNTTFSTLTGSGGGAAGAPTGGSGGNASGGDVNIVGSNGGGAGLSAVGATFMPGGHGGSTPFGIGPAGAGNSSAPTTPTNSGAGGGGCGGASATNSGAGGGGGGYVEKLLVAPSATYSYAIGGAGSGSSGTAGSGANGAAGNIIVDEYYN